MTAPVQRRPESEARFLAGAVPASASIVALVHASPLTARAARAIDAIATAMGRRREHTLLAALWPESAEMDAVVGGAGPTGFAAALSGRARLAEIAVRRGDRRYVYLPVGAASSDSVGAELGVPAGAGPPPPAALLESPELRGFVDRLRHRGGTLLLVLPKDALGSEAVRGWLDGYLSLGDSAEGVEAPAGVLHYGHLVLAEEEISRPVEHESFPVVSGDLAGEPGEAGQSRAAVSGGEPEPAGAAEAGDHPQGTRVRAGAEAGPATRGAWRRHRRPGGLPVGRVALGGVGVAVLLAAWFVFARDSVTGASGPESPEAGAAATESGETGGAAQGARGEERGGAGAGSPSDRWTAEADAAPELPYSVLIASYAAEADALALRDRLRETGEGLFFVSLTPIRGKLYHRVLAGARASPGRARSLMEELVRGGRKREASGWHLRPTRLAFRLGVYPTRREAVAARRRAEAGGIHPYILPAASERADSVFSVYAGAFESETAAAAMKEVLARADVRAPLVVRRGAPK